jgi:hypothetical protein
MEVAQSRIDSIARTFAETGVKRLFWLMYRNMVENGFQPEITRLRGEYTQVDPSTWSEDMDLTIQTGLGVGAAQGRIQNLQIVMQTQAQLAQFGLQSILLKPQNVWNVVAEMTRAIGYENPEMFFTNPGLEQEFPPPPPDPDLIKAEATAMGTQADSQIKKEEADTKLGQQMSLDKFRNSELASTVQIAALKAASDIQVANIRARGQVESAEQRASAREEASDGDSGGNPSSSE